MMGKDFVFFLVENRYKPVPFQMFISTSGTSIKMASRQELARIFASKQGEFEPIFDNFYALYL